MALDLLLVKPILGRLVQPPCRSSVPAAKAYRKVLKHRQLEVFQFRTVSRSTGRGSLGKEMGKLLGKLVQTSDNWQKCFLADLTHLMYMAAGLWRHTKPSRSARAVGVSL